MSGLSTIAAVGTYFVDDEFGDDSIGFTIAAAGFYLATLTSIIGLDNHGSTTVAIAPLPLPEGGGVNVVGSFKSSPQSLRIHLPGSESRSLRINLDLCGNIR